MDRTGGPARGSTRAWRLALGAALVIAGGSCSSASAPADGVIERRIAPSAANPAISRWNDDHLVWVAPAALDTSRQLLVLLPGSNGAPSNFRRLGRVAALQGWQVIGLMYADDIAIISVCTDPADSTCAANVRSEIIEGRDLSPYVAVDGPNSIEGRLESLLTWLAARYPSEGWNAYLNASGLRWSSIAVGGLSQGGGHAAFIAKAHPVARVLMFGSPTDGFAGQPAAWMQPGATDASRYYGFIHDRDPFTSEVPNWNALGMAAFGPVTYVEQNAPPYGGTHMLTTHLLPASGSYNDAHASVFNDYVTPRAADGTPAFADVWRYMIGAPAGPGAGGSGGPGGPTARRARCAGCSP